MAIAAHPVLSDATHVSDLPASWGTLYQLTRLPLRLVQECIEDGRINPKTERKDVAALAGKPQPRTGPAATTTARRDHTVVGLGTDMTPLDPGSGIEHGLDTQLLREFAASTIENYRNGNLRFVGNERGLAYWTALLERVEECGR